MGRVADMWSIHSALHGGEVELAPGARSRGALAVVSGISGSGSGKTLLAEEYALRFAAAYPGGVFWLRASGHDGADAAGSAGLAEQRDTSLRELATGLGLDAAGSASLAAQRDSEVGAWTPEDPGGICELVGQDGPGAAFGSAAITGEVEVPVVRATTPVPLIRWLARSSEATGFRWAG